MILTKGNLKEINIELFIDSKIASNQLESVLIVVPTNRRQRNLKKKIIDNFIEKPVSKINIETIATLTSNILTEHIGFIPLSEAASSVLIKESAEELDLEYFAAYSKGIPFGTLDKIKNVISEYKKHGITPSTLIRESEKLSGGDKKKALDIAAIYKLFLDKCNKLSALEIGDIYSKVLNLDLNQFNSYFFELFKDVETIILDGFDEFTRSEIQIIEQLSSAVNDNLIISFDYSSNENLFAHLNDTFLDLVEFGFSRITDLTPNDENGFKNIVRKKLFTSTRTEPTKAYQTKIFKNRLKNRLEEIELIAKSIKLKIINEKIAPENICVAFNNIGNYSSSARDVFTNYGIPFNLTDRISLKSAQPVIAALSLLELAENDFDFHDLSKVLTNGFLVFNGIELNNIIAVANDLKITRGLQNWESSIKDATSLLNYNDEISELEKSILTKKYSNAGKDVEKIAKLILPLKQKNSKDEFLKKFKKLLLHLKLPYTVLESSEEKEEEFIKSITVLLQSLDEVLFLLDQDQPEKKYSLQFYLDNLRTISNWARYNIKERSDYGVLITSVNEIRGLKFDYLFLGGMCDGDFPTRYSPEIFFSGSYQKKEQIHQTEERFHFYQALCSWNKNLYLTIPENDSNSELVESTFIKDLEKLFEFSQLNTNTDAQILTNEDLQISYVENRNNKQLKNALNQNKLDYSEIEKKSNVREQRKNNPFEEFNYSGFVGKGEDGIEEYLLEYCDRQFSVSQLETFAKCPFKYFSERILKINPIEEPSEEAEPIELGNVLHSILYDFYQKVIDEKIPIAEQGSQEFINLKKLLFEIAEDKISRLNLNSPIAFFEKEKILGIEGKKENSILYKFLIEETSNRNEYQPKLFELSFGKFSHKSDSETEPFMVEDLKLRGKIDRIDIDDVNKTFNIIDYKLKGRKPTSEELAEGLSLQLPVYLMAGQQLLNTNSAQNYKTDKMIIYSLDYKSDNFGPTQINLTRKRNLNSDDITKLNKELIENTKEKLYEYYHSIKNGKFSLSRLEDRENKVCRYCDYRSFCRMKEVFEV